MRVDEQGGKTVIIDPDSFRTTLLAWYDRHKRSLPWRASTPETANPYHVWLSEIMLQQTVVAAVIPYFLKFVDKWPTIHDLAAADQNEVMEAWAGLGYYARARNLHKCAQLVSKERKGVFPSDQKKLKKLPGIGDYTSAAIAAIAFNRPATVVDGNVDRVVSRYFSLRQPLPDSKPLIRKKAALLSEGQTDRPGDFAQAMMDLGATICTAKSPKCILCPLNETCGAYKEGIQQDIPYKKKKVQKPYKYGYIYWLRNNKGQILCERRQEKGLLGGMIGLPTSNWTVNPKDMQHPDFFNISDFSTLQGKKIYHSFTHFDLELLGQAIDIEREISFCDRFFWIREEEIKNLGMPTVFKKFVNLMLQDRGIDIKE